MAINQTMKDNIKTKIVHAMNCLAVNLSEFEWEIFSEKIFDPAIKEAKENLDSAFKLWNKALGRDIKDEDVCSTD